MTTPTRPMRRGTLLGTITRYGYIFTAVTGEASDFVLSRENEWGASHRTGHLTWDAASETFTAQWNPDAYPRIESNSLLAIGLVDAAQLLRRYVFVREPLPVDAGIVPAEGLEPETGASAAEANEGARS